MRSAGILCMAVLAASLAGCIGVGRSAPRIHHYRMDYHAEPPSGPPLPYVLRVPPMEVAAAYDRAPIVYREGDVAIGSYFYYRWASNPGSMISELLARDLADSGLYSDVQTSVSIVPPDFQLKGTVESIEERIDTASCSARLDLRITLSARRGPREERVRFSKLYRADEPSRCDDPRSVAAAMSRGLAAISAELQADVARELRGR